MLAIAPISNALSTGSGNARPTGSTGIGTWWSTVTEHRPATRRTPSRRLTTTGGPCSGASLYSTRNRRPVVLAEERSSGRVARRRLRSICVVILRTLDAPEHRFRLDQFVVKRRCVQQDDIARVLFQGPLKVAQHRNQHAWAERVREIEDERIGRQLECGRVAMNAPDVLTLLRRAAIPANVLAGDFVELTRELHPADLLKWKFRSD